MPVKVELDNEPLDEPRLTETVSQLDERPSLDPIPLNELSNLQQVNKAKTVRQKSKPESILKIELI